MRFDANVISGDVEHLSLLVYSQTGSRTGFQVRLVYDRGGEEDHLPERPDGLSDFMGSGPLKAGKWNVVDVTPLPTGPRWARASTLR